MPSLNNNTLTRVLLAMAFLVGDLLFFRPWSARNQCIQRHRLLLAAQLAASNSMEHRDV